MVFAKCAFFVPLSNKDKVDDYIAKYKQLIADLVKNWWIKDKYKDNSDVIEEISKTRTLIPTFNNAIEMWLRIIVEWSVPFKDGRIYLYARDFGNANLDNSFWRPLLYINNYLAPGNWADWDPLYIFKTVNKLMDSTSKTEIQFNFVSHLIYHILLEQKVNVGLECLEFFNKDKKF